MGDAVKVFLLTLIACLAGCTQQLGSDGRLLFCGCTRADRSPRHTAYPELACQAANCVRFGVVGCINAQERSPCEQRETATRSTIICGVQDSIEFKRGPESGSGPWLGASGSRGAGGTGPVGGPKLRRRKLSLDSKREESLWVSYPKAAVST